MKKSLFLLGLAVALCCLGGWSVYDAAKLDCAAEGTSYGTPADAYAVYSAAIEKYYLGGSPAPTMVIVGDYFEGESQKTCPKGTKESCAAQLADNEEFRNKLPGLAYETVKDLRSRCLQATSPLEKKLSVGVPYVILTVKEKREIEKAAAGDSTFAKLQAKYPGSAGEISFFVPGFNRAGTQALLHVSRMCGPMCMVNYYVLLEKESGRWAVKADYPYAHM